MLKSDVQFAVLDPLVLPRIHFATTAMHAYGHEWACQLVYNPRLISGLGLSDGEGTEHLWSHFIKLIGIECISSVSSYQILAGFSSLLPSNNATSGSLTTMQQPSVTKCAESSEIGLGAVSRKE